MYLHTLILEKQLPFKCKRSVSHFTSSWTGEKIGLKNSRKFATLALLTQRSSMKEFLSNSKVL